MEFKLHFETLCDSYGIKRKPTMIKNPQANAICERVHQVLGTMMRASELDMADSVHPADIDTSIDNTAWALLNLWLTSKSMNRLITNYEAVYSSNG